MRHGGGLRAERLRRAALQGGEAGGGLAGEVAEVADHVRLIEVSRGAGEGGSVERGSLAAEIQGALQSCEPIEDLGTDADVAFEDALDLAHAEGVAGGDVVDQGLLVRVLQGTG